jgi:hypothetical protein
MSEAVKFIVGEPSEEVVQQDVQSAAYVRHRLKAANEKAAASNLKANFTNGAGLQKALAKEEARINSNVLNYWERRAGSLILQAMLGASIVKANQPEAYRFLLLPPPKK